MPNHTYNQYEQMSRREKDQVCDENSRIIQEKIQHRVERERLFEYDLRQNNQSKNNTNGQKLKRQLTSASRIDAYEEPNDDPFITVSTNAKRKQQRTNDKEPNGEQDDIIQIVDRITPTTATSNGGRLFINSKNRTNKNQNNTNTNDYHMARHRHTNEGKNENDMSVEEEMDFDNPSLGRRTNEKRSEKENRNDKDQNQNDKKNNEYVNQEDYPISKHALQYAVEHHLPPIHIDCEPRINDHQKGSEIIKSLFKHIEKNFRKSNNDYQHPVGFDYWYIDKKGSLTCYTRHTELFVYLCEPNNYPKNINDTTIATTRPKHLPTNHSLILKFVPNYITIDEVEEEINANSKSMFSIEEMKGSKTEKFRHIRLELKETSEYEQMLKHEQISISGCLIEVQEFLAPPRLLMCSKCNDPGHIRKHCALNFDACRRCGKDRSTGDHDNCTICCHRCKQDHLATDYKCKFLVEYRRSLLVRLKEKPNLLPPNVRIFIPSNCRDRGIRNNKILTNQRPINNAYESKQANQQPFNINAFSWPTPSGNKQSQNQTLTTNHEQLIWDELKNKQDQIDKLKDDFNLKLQSHETKYNDHLKKMNLILVSLYQQTKHQNESVERCYTTINEVLPILSSTLEVIQRITIKHSSTNNSDADNNSTHEILHHISQALNFIKDRNELLVTNQKALNNLVEQQGQLMIKGINSLIPDNELSFFQ